MASLDIADGRSGLKQKIWRVRDDANPTPRPY